MVLHGGNPCERTGIRHARSIGGVTGYQNLILGSSQASRRSDRKTPMTVSVLIIRMMLPARYMSWDIIALSRSGPAVGRLRTMPMIASPDTRPGRIYPEVLTKGLSAIRTGYLRISLRSSIPFALAVTT